MIKGMSFKVKIASPLVLMTVGLIIVSSILISQYRNQLTQARGLSKASDMILNISAFIHELQKERARSVLFMNKKMSKEELVKQRSSVDDKFKSISMSLENYKSETINERIKKEELNLKQIRAFVDEEQKPAAEIAKFIGDSINKWIFIQVSCANEYHLNGYETNLISTSIFEKSKESMGKLRAALNVILSFDHAVSAAAVSQLSENVAGVLTNIDSPGLSISTENRKQIQNILNSDDWKMVMSIYGKVIEKSGEGKFGYDPKDFSETITRVIDSLREVIVTEIKQSNDKIKDSESASSKSFSVGLGLVVMLILFSLIFSYIIVNSANKTLITVASELMLGSDMVSKISQELASTSQTLSSSSTQQAAALQQTTASIEETSAMTAKNAENAKRSAEVSKRNQETATQGQASIHEMISSINNISESNVQIMQQIEKSNHEISEIIQIITDIGEKTKVINDIVFQTKLLSFNASVEAARAGEQGKGFAVVAEEIGNLAQMSGSAAKEISTMLEKSTTKVDEIVKNMLASVSGLMEASKNKIDNGIGTANRCNQVFTEIVKDVSQVDRLVSEISNASQEQAKGVEEINKAMVELDSAAQQNNSASQSAAGSASELKNQVTILQEMIQKLNGIVYGA